MVLKPNKVIMKQNVAYCALTMATGEFRLLETLNDVKQLETMSSLEDRRSCGAVTPACMIRGISRQGVPAFLYFCYIVYLWRHWAFPLSCAGFLQWLRAGAVLSLHCAGLSGCRAQPLGARASAAAVPQLWSMGWAAPRHMGSSGASPLHWQADSSPLSPQGGLCPSFALWDSMSLASQ